MIAEIDQNHIAVTRIESRGEVILEVAAPDGWDSAKKHQSMILGMGGVMFANTGWNSDRNVSYFKPVTPHRAAVVVVR